MDQPCQPHISRPTAKLIDANNLERAPLAYQRNAVAAENARVECASTALSILPNPSLQPPSLPPTTSESPSDDSPSDDSNNSNKYQSSYTASKRTIVFSSDDEETSNSGQKKKRRKNSSLERSNSKH